MYQTIGLVMTLLLPRTHIPDQSQTPVSCPPLKKKSKKRDIPSQSLHWTDT